MSYTYDYPRPCVTADSLVFRKIGGQWYVLLIERGNEPYKGCWALPGGFVEEDEDIDDTAERELREETCMEGIELRQLRAFGRPDRDPRHRTVTIAYMGIDTEQKAEPRAADDAARVRWFRIDRLPALAFDHDEIIACGIAELKKME